MEARHAFEQLVKLDPNCALAHFTLARAMSQQGDYAQAAKGFQKCLQLDSDYLLAYLLAGQNFEKLNEPKQALHSYEQGLLRAQALGAEDFEKQFNALIVTGQ